MSEDYDALNELKSCPQKWKSMLDSCAAKLASKAKSRKEVTELAGCHRTTLYRFLKSKPDTVAVGLAQITAILLAFDTSPVQERDRLKDIKDDSYRTEPNNPLWMIDSNEAAALLSKAENSFYFKLDEWSFKKSNGVIQNFSLAKRESLLATKNVVSKAQRIRKMGIISGQAGLGKTIFFYKYVCQTENTIMIDMLKMIDAEKFSFDTMEKCLSKTFSEYSTKSLSVVINDLNRPHIILDHLIPVLRKHAVFIGIKWTEILDQALMLLEKINKNYTTPLIIIFDSRCDGEIDTDAQSALEKMNLKTLVLEMAIQPKRIQEITCDIHRQKVNIIAEPNHLKLAIFLNAYYNKPSSEGRLVEIMRNLENKEARHFLHDIADDVVGWATDLLHLDSQAKNPILKEKTIADCVFVISKELTWDWLYIAKFGYSGSSVLGTLIKLHNVLGRGPFRETMALSNIISLLSYWDEYDRPFREENNQLHLEKIYLYSNFTRAFFKSGKISNAVLHCVDLTQVFWEEGFEFQDVSFIGCLFEEQTFETVSLLQEKNGGVLERCYCLVEDKISDYKVISKVK